MNGRGMPGGRVGALDHRAPRAHPALAGSGVLFGVAAVGFCALLALLVSRFDAPIVLGLLLLGLLAVAFLLWPDLATVGGVFLLYTNIPTLASKQGVPTFVASSFMLLFGFPLLRHVIARRERFRFDEPFVLMLAFLPVLILSALGARGPQIATDYILTYVLEGLVLYWLVVNVIRTRTVLLRVIWTVLAAGALLGALTSYQEITGSFRQQFGGLAQRNYEYLELRQQLEQDVEGADEILRQLGAGGRSIRPGGPFGEPNRFAQVLIVLLPLAVVAYRSGHGRATRLAAAAAGVLILGGIVFSDSRTAFIALGLTAAVIVYWRWIRPAYFVAALLVIVLLVPVLAPRSVQRLSSITSVAQLQDRRSSSQEVDGAIRGRLTEMLAASRAFLDHPLLGVGPGQYAPFYSVEYQQRDPRLKFRDLRIVRRAHSLYLEMAAELGIVGLGLFLAIILRVMRELWKARRHWTGRSDAQVDLATGFLLSLWMYLATAVFTHLSYQRYYWLLLALAGAAVHVLRSPPLAERQPDASTAMTGTGGWR